MYQLISSVFLTVALAGCATDLASTSATEAALNAQEAKQAQQLTDQVRSQLNAAMRTEQDRLQQAEKASNRKGPPNGWLAAPRWPFDYLTRWGHRVPGTAPTRCVSA